MVSVTKTMKIACVVMPDGIVSFTLADQTSINTIGKKWRKGLEEERRAEHKEANTQGGVVIVTMLADDYFRMMPKENVHAEITQDPNN